MHFSWNKFCIIFKSIKKYSNLNIKNFNASHLTLATPDWRPLLINFHQDFDPLKLFIATYFCTFFFALSWKAINLSAICDQLVCPVIQQTAEMWTLIPHVTPGVFWLLACVHKSQKCEMNFHEIAKRICSSHIIHFTHSRRGICYIWIDWMVGVASSEKIAASAAEFLMMAKNGI